MCKPWIWTAAVLALVPGLSADETRPIPVSPGTRGVPTHATAKCLTFSWSGSKDARGYELVLYRLADSGALEVELQVKVNGDARGWTPSSDECPVPGSYAWAVRAITDEGFGPWSEPALFSTGTKSIGTGISTEIRVPQIYRDLGLVAGDEKLTPRAESPLLPDQLEQTVSPSLGQSRKALTASTVGANPNPEPGLVTVPTAYSLSISGPVQLGGDVFKDGKPFLHTGGPDSIRNIAIGSNAMVRTDNTEARDNVVLGYGALQRNRFGAFNVVAGNWAMYRGDSGFFNVALGYNSLRYNAVGDRDVAVGANALYHNSTGSRNVAVGYKAMYSNTLGGGNTATGTYTLSSNTTGGGNTAMGFGALSANVGGLGNTAVGVLALQRNPESYFNTAIGHRSMFLDEQGRGNAALGWVSLYYLESGSFNTAVGPAAGYFLEEGDFNIFVGAGANGSVVDANTIRVGGLDFQNRTFIEGISATPVSGTQVRITADDQLGVVASSARFKQGIRDLQGVSERLADLRPVSFRYKDKVAGKGANPIEYGLVAEEVAEVFPELVVNDNEGRPFTVRYDLLTPLLLGEIQRQDRDLAALRRRLEALERGQ